MHVTTINGKKAINLKESKKGYMGVGREESEGRNVVTIL